MVRVLGGECYSRARWNLVGRPLGLLLSKRQRAPDEERLRERPGKEGRVSRAVNGEPAAGPACGRGMPPNAPCEVAPT